MASSLAAPPLPFMPDAEAERARADRTLHSSEMPLLWRLVHNEEAGALMLLRRADPPPVAEDGRLVVLRVEHGRHRAAVAARNCDSAGKTHGGIFLNGVLAVPPGRVKGGTHVGAGVHVRVGKHDVHLLRPSGHLFAHGCGGATGYLLFIDGKQPSYVASSRVPRCSGSAAPLKRDAFWSRVYLRVLLVGLLLGALSTAVVTCFTIGLAEAVKFLLNEDSLLREESHGSDAGAGSEEGPGGSEAPSEPDAEPPIFENPVSMIYFLVFIPPCIALFFVFAGVRGLVRHSPACQRACARDNGSTGGSTEGPAFAVSEGDEAGVAFEYHEMPGECSSADLDQL